MAKDLFHDAVVVALQKEGWTITHDPYKLESLDTTVFIDLGAELVIAAQREKELIAVEIKSFVGNSYVRDFYGALGQYMTYLRALKSKDPERKLVLAVPQKAYIAFFIKDDVRSALVDFGVNLLVYSSQKQTITHWFYI